MASWSGPRSTRSAAARRTPNADAVADTAAVLHPHALSSRHIQTYDREGWLVIDDVFPPNEVLQLRKILEGEVQQQPSLTESGRAQLQPRYGIDLTTKHPSFLALARDPRVVGRVRSLLGPDIVVQHSKSVHKTVSSGGPGGGGPVKFHQDFAYFPHTNTSVLAVMVCLDDFSVSNGCMRVASGSHKLGLLDHNIGPDGLFNAGFDDASKPEHHPELWADESKLDVVRVVTFSFLCPLLEKYGTFIARCNALIEKVSSFR
eukprot:SAG31_NODE_1169_length_9565_cov_3.703571_3_plen_260_part_00